jgi:hypothetical protein
MVSRFFGTLQHGYLFFGGRVRASHHRVPARRESNVVSRLVSEDPGKRPAYLLADGPPGAQDP